MLTCCLLFESDIFRLSILNNMKLVTLSTYFIVEYYLFIFALPLLVRELQSQSHYFLSDLICCSSEPFEVCCLNNIQ